MSIARYAGPLVAALVGVGGGIYIFNDAIRVEVERQRSVAAAAATPGSPAPAAAVSAAPPQQQAPSQRQLR